MGGNGLFLFFSFFFFKKKDGFMGENECGVE